MFFSSNDPLTRQLHSELEDFLLDRQARNLSPRTVSYYARSLAVWRDFLLTQNVTKTEDVTPTHVRRYLVDLADKGHSPGGIVTLYTAVRVFLRWYAEEYPRPGWNPLAKIKAPKRSKERLPPLSLADFAALVEGCPRRSFNGDRDRALLLLLLDTGVRHQELTNLTVGAVDVHTGQVIVRRGRGVRAGRYSSAQRPVRRLRSIFIYDCAHSGMRS